MWLVLEFREEEEVEGEGEGWLPPPPFCVVGVGGREEGGEVE